MNMNDVHWLAGLMEGEAWFGAAPPSQPNVPYLRVAMADKEVIDRLHELLGGTLKVWPKRAAHHQDQWAVELRAGDAIAVMKMMRPLMSSRRQAAIDKAIASYNPTRRVRPAKPPVLELADLIRA